MTQTNRMKYLRIALMAVGLIFTFALWPLTIVWPSGWSWHAEGRSYYLEMILALYATLGVFLMLAARNPTAHLSLIWFAVWSSVAHAGVMTVQAWRSPEEHVHFIGDIALLLIVALVLGALTWRATRGSEAPSAAVSP